MDIGIGLPNTLAVAGPTVVEWARRAEERGFKSLATIDRIVYPSYDSLTTLAVAAGATSTIKLFPNILLGPIYPPVWLAKATASLDALSGGRLMLGVGVETALAATLLLRGLSFWLPMIPGLLLARHEIGRSQ